MALRIKRDKLDILFAKYIKQRDKYCQRCGCPGGQTSHFWGRARRSVRYDSSNACLLCFGCHQYFHANPEEYRQFMLARLGEDEFNLLEGRMRQVGKVDTELLTLYYKEAIRRLGELGDGE